MNQDELTLELIALVNRLIDMRVAERVKPLEAKLKQVESLQSEWVDTKEALKITGLKKPQTLKAERERPGTMIVVKFEGKNNRTPRYLRVSLLAYNDKKTKHWVTAPTIIPPRSRA